MLKVQLERLAGRQLLPLREQLHPALEYARDLVVRQLARTGAATGRRETRNALVELFGGPARAARARRVERADDVLDEKRVWWERAGRPFTRRVLDRPALRDPV
ncbi:MAG TPA: hypothetical protein VES88_18560 [Gemmatimonadaceae bacterium]|nr:hypothetical protein [Gemmatimonadaceae bacterium]